MSLNYDNILSIGSIVKLKGTDGLAMVVGYTQVSDDNTYSDYLGVKYPAGLDNKREFLKFNSEDITGVEFKGYSNDIEVKLKRKIVDMTKELNNSNK